MPQVQQSVFIGSQASELLTAQFGVSTQDIHDVVRRIYAGFSVVTSLHPKGFSGTNAWAQGTSSMRELFIPMGWQPDDPSGQPRVVSRSRRVAITVSSGDPHTGDPHHDPQTRNDKGAQTSNSVSFNSRQGQLFEVVTATDRRAAQASDAFALWIFLYYIDLDSGEVRFELSKPSDMSDANKVVGWSARMIFPPLNFRSSFESDDEADGMPDIDIDVVPKM